jgi:HK97 family phage portal protein
VGFTDRVTDLIFGRRDAIPAPNSMIGFGPDGGVAPPAVSSTSVQGLSAVWRSLDILSNGVSQLEWSERRGNLELPESRLVVRPQADRERREWTTIVVNTLALYDVCYLLKVGGTDSEGVPMGLWYLQPILVTPVTQDIFTIDLPNRYYLVGQEIDRDQLVIIHRSPQPGIWDTVGGVLNLARTMFAAALSAENYASRYWQAGGAPTTVLETDTVLRGITAEQLQEKWRESRGRGPDYAAVLEGGLHAKEFGADPTAQAAVEARREQVADIGRYFGIPTRILNAPEGAQQTYHASEEANQDLVRYTLQNYIGAIEDAISSQLPGGRRMVMDSSRLTRSTHYAEAQTLQLLTGNKPVMTQGEAREILGLPPLEDPSELQAVPAPTASPVGGNTNGP